MLLSADPHAREACGRASKAPDQQAQARAPEAALSGPLAASWVTRNNRLWATCPGRCPWHCPMAEVENECGHGLVGRNVGTIFCRRRALRWGPVAPVHGELPFKQRLAVQTIRGSGFAS